MLPRRCWRWRGCGRSCGGELLDGPCAASNPHATIKSAQVTTKGCPGEWPAAARSLSRSTSYSHCGHSSTGSRGAHKYADPRGSGNHSQPVRFKTGRTRDPRGAISRAKHFRHRGEATRFEALQRLISARLCGDRPDRCRGQRGSSPGAVDYARTRIELRRRVGARPALATGGRRRGHQGHLCRSRHANSALVRVGRGPFTGSQPAAETFRAAAEGGPLRDQRPGDCRRRRRGDQGAGGDRRGRRGRSCVWT